jgi:AraC-like DNA-binding protein
MKYNYSDVDILNHLVGKVSDHIAAMMEQNLECFLHPKVSLFVPSSGQCEYAIMPSHIHPSYTFIYYFQPVSDFVVKGIHKSYDLADGKCLTAMSPDVPHQEVEEEFFQSYIAIAIEADFLHNIMLQYTPVVPVFCGEVFVPHTELLSLLRCFMLEASKLRNSELLDHLAFIITHLVVHSVTSDMKPTVHLYNRFEVDRAIAYMNSHFSEKITIEGLAEYVNISAGHFSKIFKSVTRDTPIDFLNKLRLQKARILLMSNGKNITEIALDCGFKSSSYFSTCFLEKYKITPSAYRAKMLKTVEKAE